MKSRRPDTGVQDRITDFSGFGNTWLRWTLAVGVLVGGCTGSSGGIGPGKTPDPLCPSPGAGVAVGGRFGTTDAVVTPGRRIVLMGGGSEDDSAATRFAEGAGGGDILILRASGSLTSYPDYFLTSLSPSPRPASAVTLLTSVPGAGHDPAVLCWVSGAEAIWLAGGDQWDYLGLWPPQLHQALGQLNARGGAIGGTSAGAASMGEAAFDARYGTVTSPEVLSDPMRQEVSLEYPTFAASELHGALVDSHFSDRGREGRLLGFLARFLSEKNRAEVLGIGLDEGVALVIEGGGYRVYAPAGQFAWFYRVTGPSRLENGVPLDLSGIQRVRSDAGTEGPWPPDFGTLQTSQLQVRGGVVGPVE